MSFYKCFLEFPNFSVLGELPPPSALHRDNLHLRTRCQEELLA